MKLKNWLDIWLYKHIRLSVKRRTFGTYKDIAERHIAPLLGEYELGEISAEILQDFVIEKLERGNLVTGGKLASNTVLGIVGVLKQLLNRAYILEMIPKNPSTHIVLPKPEEKEVTAFEKWEQDKIIAECFASGKNNHLGIVICFYTGMRIGELLALTYDDVDFNKKLLRINKTTYYMKEEEKAKIFVDNPKTKNSARVIPLPDELLAILKTMREKAVSNYIISTKKGSMLTARNYQRTYGRILENAKVGYKNFHSIRHTFATRALELGIDVKTVSELLGHKSPMITLNRYAHSMLSYKTDMMNKLVKSLITA